jgi:hypothetical protein
MNGRKGPYRAHRPVLRRVLDQDWAAIGWWMIIALGKLSTTHVITEYDMGLGSVAAHREEPRSLLEQHESRYGGR